MDSSYEEPDQSETSVSKFETEWDTFQSSKRRRLTDTPSPVSSHQPQNAEFGIMNVQFLENEQLFLEQERHRLDSSIATARADSDFKRFETLVKLSSEINTQELLVQQLKESLHKVETIKSHCDNLQQRITVPRQPLDTPEILEHILQFVNVDDLLKCRRVSTFWNKEVVRVITNLPKPIYIGTLQPYAIFYQKFVSDFEMLSRNKNLTPFQALLRKTKNPEVFMKTITFCDEFTTKIPRVKKLLEEYGMYVNNLHINSSGNFKFLHKCLGPCGYCPNLEVLSVEIPPNCVNKPPGFLIPSKIGPLNLTQLSIIHYDFFEYNNYRGVLALLKSLLTNSPHIEKLRIMTLYTKTHLYIELLQSFPHITTNLKEFHISGNFLGNIKGLCKIPFSTKLKKLVLEKLREDYRHQESEVPASRDAMAQFLKLLSQSLEYLHLDLPRGNDFIDNKCDIPMLPKLRIFSFSEGLGPFNYFQVLNNCPSLKELIFEYFTSLDLHEFLETHIEGKKLPARYFNSYVPRLVHKKLEKIKLKNSDQDDKFMLSNTLTINILNAIFPSFSHLEIKINPGVCVERHQSWFENCFQAISEMELLKVLHIDFFDWGCDEMLGMKVDLAGAFKNLKQTPRLERLTLWRLDDDFKSNIIFTSLSTFADAPNLRSITLRYLRVKDENLKVKFAELKNEFCTRNISLQAKDDYPVSLGYLTGFELI